eukprot:2960740-Rhodomonas_salina.2
MTSPCTTKRYVSIIHHVAATAIHYLSTVHREAPTVIRHVSTRHRVTATAIRYVSTGLRVGAKPRSRGVTCTVTRIQPWTDLVAAYPTSVPGTSYWVITKLISYSVPNMWY